MPKAARVAPQPGFAEQRPAVLVFIQCGQSRTGAGQPQVPDAGTGLTCPDFRALGRSARSTPSWRNAPPCLDEAQWQARSAPYLVRMLETGHYPKLYRVVAEAEHPDSTTGSFPDLN
jgi:hypothetical protein